MTEDIPQSGQKGVFLTNTPVEVANFPPLIILSSLNREHPSCVGVHSSPKQRFVSQPPTGLYMLCDQVLPCDVTCCNRQCNFLVTPLSGRVPSLTQVCGSDESSFIKQNDQKLQAQTPGGHQSTLDYLHLDC